MTHTVIAKAREFHHRFLKLSDTSGYDWVFNVLTLMQDYLPCDDISMDVVRPIDNHPETIEARLPVLGILNEKNQYALDLFYNLYLKIPFAKRLAKRFKQHLVQGEQVIPLGFADDDETANGIIHSFYSMLKIDDVLTTFGLLNTHQLLKLPETENYYIVVFSIARHDGRFYNDEEKHLFAHCFELFLADFKRKIACAGHCVYLPYLCLEKFKPRELASIKACFDLKLNQQAVTRVNLANALHKAESSENLKQALYKVDYDLAKIKKLIFTDIKNTTDASIIALINDFDWQDVVEVFKLYAYFGFYSDPKLYLYSNLPSKMGKWAVR